MTHFFAFVAFALLSRKSAGLKRLISLPIPSRHVAACMDVAVAP